jgi:fucose 4-O-acetylase-like acetyltransferase
MSSQGGRRIAWLDNARGLAIVLLYIVHIMDRLHEVGYSAMFPVWGLLTVMLVPLFLFISGAVARPGSHPPLTEIVEKFRKCFSPVVFFSVMMLPFWLLDGKSFTDVQQMAGMYLYGSPRFHWPMWYLIALFWVELFRIIVFGVFGAARGLSLIWCLLFIELGYFATPFLVGFNLRHGLPIEFWFMAESLVCAAFYFAGHAARPWIDAMSGNAFCALLGACAFGSAVFAACMNVIPGFKAVIMSFSLHGNYAWFIATAILGVLSVIIFAKLLPSADGPLKFLGRHSLFYFGLNGVCFHVLDRHVLLALPRMPDNFPVLLLFSLAYTILMLIIFKPFVLLLKRYCSSLLAVAR